MVIFDQLPPKQLLTLLTLMILVVSIPVVVYLVKTEQIFKSKAAEGTRLEFVDGGGNLITTTSSRNVKLKLTYALPVRPTSSPPQSSNPDADGDGDPDSTDCGPNDSGVCTLLSTGTPRCTTLSTDHIQSCR